MEQLQINANKRKISNGKSVRKSEKLLESYEQATGNDNSAGYGDKKHLDLIKSKKQVEQNGERSTDAKKKKIWETPQLKYSMKFESR